jgi:hypothetical protein
MARVTGLEPATFGVTGRRSNQLSYTPATATLMPRERLAIGQPSREVKRHRFGAPSRQRAISCGVTMWIESGETFSAASMSCGLIPMALV